MAAALSKPASDLQSVSRLMERIGDDVRAAQALLTEACVHVNIHSMEQAEQEQFEKLQRAARKAAAEVAEKARYARQLVERLRGLVL